jgi:hypothetical protein
VSMRECGTKSLLFASDFPRYIPLTHATMLVLNSQLDIVGFTALSSNVSPLVLAAVVSDPKQHITTYS